MLYSKPVLTVHADIRHPFAFVCEVVEKAEQLIYEIVPVCILSIKFSGNVFDCGRKICHKHKNGDYSEDKERTVQNCKPPCALRHSADKERDCHRDTAEKRCDSGEKIHKAPFHASESPAACIGILLYFVIQNMRIAVIHIGIIHIHKFIAVKLINRIPFQLPVNIYCFVYKSGNKRNNGGGSKRYYDICFQLFGVSSARKLADYQCGKINTDIRRQRRPDCVYY